MKINDIYESTTAGSIATVATPMSTQKRNGVGKGVYGNEKAGNLLTGKKTNKPYANSKVNESKRIEEAHLEEDDLIIVPGQGRTRKTGFIKHGESRLDHEVEMARSDLFSAAKNAKQVYELIADVSEEEGLEGWVQEKIIKANDYLNTIREYLEGKQLQNEMTGGVGEDRVDELSSELYSRAIGAAKDRARDVATNLGKQDYGGTNMSPGERFWLDKSEKFRQGYVNARGKEEKKDYYDKNTSGMSPAQKRQFDKSFGQGK
jgi:hypothetical protein